MDPLLVLITRLDRIEAKLDQVLDAPPPEVVPVRDCLALTGCNSLPAQYRWFKRYGVRPYAFGKYRRLEITNKVASLRLAARAA